MKDPNNQQDQQDNQESEETKDDSISEVLNFDKPDFTFVPKANHEWRQQGPYLCCKSCEVEHAVWVGTDKMLVGLDEKGQPILKTRAELGMD